MYKAKIELKVKVWRPHGKSRNKLKALYSFPRRAHISNDSKSYGQEQYKRSPDTVSTLTDIYTHSTHTTEGLTVTGDYWRLNLFRKFVSSDAFSSSSVSWAPHFNLHSTQRQLVTLVLSEASEKGLNRSAPITLSPPRKAREDCHLPNEQTKMRKWTKTKLDDFDLICICSFTYTPSHTIKQRWDK